MSIIVPVKRGQRIITKFGATASMPHHAASSEPPNDRVQ
jgi:hypothetical protein